MIQDVFCTQPPVKDLKSLLLGRLRFEGKTTELKVFTLPTCSSCPAAKTIASEVAEEFGIAYKEINLATREGLNEALTYDILSAPSIAIDKEVIIRGRLVSKERLEDEVGKRIEKWRERVSGERVQST
ncbi:thioredoxin family protein [Candidatus Bathyarchaeota archaeon]|nr:thioredoxin family protein [Candidatus Bathyarchaeota archaeon]